MHEKDNTQVEFGSLAKYAAMILASAFGSLRHFVALLVITWFQWEEILAVLMMRGQITHVVALLVILLSQWRQKICIPKDDLASLSLCRTVGSSIITKWI